MKRKTKRKRMYAKRRNNCGRKHLYSRRNPRRLSVPEKHQLKIARQTLRMSDAWVNILGGMNKAEARAVIKRLTGRTPRENPPKGSTRRALIIRAQSMLAREHGEHLMKRIRAARKIGNPGKKKPEFGLKVDWRTYKCKVCGHKQPISTNHTDEVWDYCKNCSWKSFGFDRANTANFGGRAYRRFKFVKHDHYK